MLLKVGDLAKRCGLSVRMLHHYDTIGLLTPSARSDSGYRLYDKADVACLHQIQALRRLGMLLADVGASLANPDIPFTTIVERQIAMLDQQITQASVLCDRLLRLHGQLVREEEPELTEWLTTLEWMTMYGKYLSQEERARAERMDADTARHERWVALVSTVQDAMKRQVASRSSEAQALAEKAPCQLSGADLVAQGEGRLEYAGMRCVHVGARTFHALQTGFDDRKVAGVAAGMATEFAAEEELAVALGGSGEGPVFAKQIHDHGVRRAELAHQVQVQRALIPMRRRGRQQRRQMVERCAAGVKVDHDICARQQFGFDIVRNHLGQLPVAHTRKHAVQVAPVDRGSARAIDDRREIQARNHDQPATRGHRWKPLEQFHQGDRAFVFVPVITTREQHGRARTGAGIAHRNGNRNMPVGGAVV
ncbi:DNA-binding transcriptional MerR regulator [Ralstonia pickettii]